MNRICCIAIVLLGVSGLIGCNTSDPSPGAQDLTFRIESPDAAIERGTFTNVNLLVLDRDETGIEGELSLDEQGPFIGTVAPSVVLPLPDPAFGFTVRSLDPAAVQGEGALTLLVDASAEAALAEHQVVVAGELQIASGLRDLSRSDHASVRITVTGSCVRESMPAVALSASAVNSFQSRAAAVTDDGRLFVWGGNSIGQEFDEDHQRRVSVPALINWLAPQHVPFTSSQGLDAWLYVSARDSRIYTARDGVIQAFGRYNLSELEARVQGAVGPGFDTREITGIPVPVVGLSHEVFPMVALGIDGSVWRFEFEGPLDSRNLVPVRFDGITQAVALSGKLALRADGTVMSWGDESPPVPLPVAGLSDVIAISVGAGHALALRRDGTVLAWGNGLNGQLGDGASANRDVPAPVTGLSDIIAISASGNNSHAVRRDGTVWGWGSNRSGELGDGTTDNNRSLPVQAAGIDNAVSVHGAGSFTLALRTDGSVWAWGQNDDGQLGNGSTSDEPRPLPGPVLGFGPATTNDCATPPPSPAAFVLEVVRVGAVGTIVFSTPVGVECGFACAATFAAGSTVRLRASIPNGAAFSGWSGCDRLPAGENPYPDCEVDIDANRSVEVRVE